MTTFKPWKHLKYSLGSSIRTWLKIWTKDINVSNLTASKVVATDASKNLATVTAAAALTTQLTTITCSAPGTADYAIADLTNTGGYGFAAADEGQSVLKVIANLQVRVGELETKLKAHGLLA